MINVYDAFGIDGSMGLSRFNKSRRDIFQTTNNNIEVVGERQLSWIITKIKQLARENPLVYEVIDYKKFKNIIEIRKTRMPQDNNLKARLSNIAHTLYYFLKTGTDHVSVSSMSTEKIVIKRYIRPSESIEFILTKEWMYLFRNRAVYDVHKHTPKRLVLNARFHSENDYMRVFSAEYLQNATLTNRIKGFIAVSKNAKNYSFSTNKNLAIKNLDKQILLLA